MKKSLILSLFAFVFGPGITHAAELMSPMQVMTVEYHGNNTARLCPSDLLAECVVFTGPQMAALVIEAQNALDKANAATEMAVYYDIQSNGTVDMVCVQTLNPENLPFDQGKSVGCAVIDGRG